MPILGIIGGIAPESTIAYYRLLVAGFRAHYPDAYPRIVINSIDLAAFLQFIGTGDQAAVVAFLVAEVQRVANAGADLAFFASNTPHLVFDQVRRQSPIPLVSIVEATGAKAQALGLTRVGLLGTRFTMEGSFYPIVLGARGISVHPPEVEDRNYVHQIYVTELVDGLFRPETREELVAVIHRLRDRAGVEAVILGGTELPLILGPETAAPVPLLNTTEIHVEAVLNVLLQLAAADPTVAS
jgi:aspartate racemase